MRFLHTETRKNRREMSADIVPHYARNYNYCFICLWTISLWKRFKVTEITGHLKVWIIEETAKERNNKSFCRFNFNLFLFLFSRQCLLLFQLFYSCLCIQFAPLEISGGGECALLLNGPPKSSVFDYTFNLLRGNSL